MSHQSRQDQMKDQDYQLLSNVALGVVGWLRLAPEA